MGVVAIQTSFAFAEGEPQREPAARDQASSASSSTNDDEEYNFSWLDPDKKVYVLQNRKYRKASRFAAYIAGGVNLSNPYRTEYIAIPRGSYWFTEQFGVEAFYAMVSNSQNHNFTALKNTTSVLPFVRENKSYFGALATWTPWYAKLNFFNKILYFDWFVNLGAGQVQTSFDQNNRADLAPSVKTENLFAWYFGTGHNYYVTRNFLVRLDLIGMMYSATAADNKGTRNTFNYDFTAGLGYLF